MAPSPPSTCLLILGMHRSGTSCVTRICNLLGAELGSNLIPPAPDNKTGFWEHADMVTLNETLLESLGTSHLGATLLPSGWTDRASARALHGKASQLLTMDFGSAPLFALKDPRLCRTLPIWQKALEELGADTRYLIVFRNPMEVAESLHKRNGIPLRDGLLLWLLYNLEAEFHSRGCRRVFLYYPDVLDDWQGCMERAAKQLGLSWPNSYDSVFPDVTGFIKPGMRHNQASDRLEDMRIDDALRPLLRESFNFLMRATRQSKAPDEAAFNAIYKSLKSRIAPTRLRRFIRRFAVS